METQQKFSTGNLRKQSTFRNVTTGFPAKWRVWNKRRNSILMTCHYPVLGLRKIFFRHERLKEKRKRKKKSLRCLSRTFAWRMHSFSRKNTSRRLWYHFLSGDFGLNTVLVRQLLQLLFVAKSGKSRIIILKGSNVE